MLAYWCPSQNYRHRYLSALTFSNGNMKTSFPCCKCVVFSIVCGVVATAAAAEIFPINLWWFSHVVSPDSISFLFSVLHSVTGVTYTTTKYLYMYCTAFPYPNSKFKTYLHWSLRQYQCQWRKTIPILLLLLVSLSKWSHSGIKKW